MKNTNKNEISKLYANEQLVRLIAAQLSVLTLLSLLNHWLFLLLFLAVDFALRAFTFWPSPLAAVAKIVAELLKLNTKPIFAAPKKFAAGLGFVFSLTALLLFILQFFTAACIIGGILIICAVLESVFKVCIGCYVFNWTVAPILNKRNKNQETTDAGD